jgi:alcohol dehydrogenase class IV
VKFEFATAGRIVFGRGSSADAGALIADLGRRAFIVCGRTASRADWLERSIAAAGGVSTRFCVAGEPTVAVAQAATARARQDNCDVVVGLGGGSALDTAKAVAALVTNPGDIFDYLEVIGKGRPLTLKPRPCVAIPTTAGTGSEVTRNAVLSSPEHRLKVSLRSPGMLPRLAIVDPELALGLPSALTASTGCDALAQLIEPFVSARANPMTDALCREGLKRVARSLQPVCADGSDLAAREDLALASLLGGIALANAGLGAVHGLASPIGGRYDAPHGAVCGALLAPALEVNWEALRAQNLSTERFDELGQILTGHAGAGAGDAVAWIRRLVGVLGIPPLSQYGLADDAADSLGTAALGTSSLKANPVALSASACAEIVRRAL